ncbi:tRNA (guanine(37)-N1)-methyltransferase Trm5a [uncultured archaeon]|nr:tRNA (guanine(37)-N1)-methyltransferase Trm5a [uncultured archaeon]
MSHQALLKDKLPPEKLSRLPKGFEVIGDIAIIYIPQSLDDEKYLIAQALVSHRKDVNIVLRKINKLAGTQRVGDFEILLGNRTTTLHRENDCVFHVDLKKAYFSGKLAYERNRIVQMVNDGEDILVLFCGVGPFLIPIAKKKNASIVGLDSNADACEYFRINAELNKIDADIILGDAGSICSLFKRKFDRIVMPAPYGQDYFLNLASSLLKPEGAVHFYTFKKDFEISHFKKLLEKKRWIIDFYRNCGGVAPRVSRYGFDLRQR